MSKKIGKHYFTPENIGENERPSKFCKKCGKYLTDEKHIRG